MMKYRKRIRNILKPKKDALRKQEKDMLKIVGEENGKVVDEKISLDEKD